MTLSGHLARLSGLTRQLRSELLQRLANDGPRSVWPRLARRYTRQTGIEDSRGFADAVAQAVTCASFTLRSAAAAGLGHVARRWLLDQADPLVAQVFLASQLVSDTRHGDERSSVSPSLRTPGKIVEWLDRTTVELLDGALASESSPADVPLHFYERFLQAHDQDQRRCRGVFYTPEDVVTFMVSQVDRLLRQEFNLAGGLLDDARWGDVIPAMNGSEASGPEQLELPFVRLFDPAMGAGVFLQGVVRHAYQQHVQQQVAGRSFQAREAGRWSQLVEQTLLPRISGAELMLPALVLAQIQMAVELAATGYAFAKPGKLHFYLADTLRQPHLSDAYPDMQQAPFSIILGNPPFSGISTNRQPWIRRLLRGESPDGPVPVANYFQVDQRPLSERKHWLEDDYVKFMRFAHWQIERSGVGLVALVTNHAFLDNSTFRGMRQQLLQAFPHMTLVDLHGNQRRGIAAGQHPRDESIFPIEQGVSISLLRRPPGNPTSDSSQVAYFPLRGSKTQKLRQLKAAADQSFETVSLQPRSPHYFLVPHDHQGQEEYDRGHRLVDVMPVHSTAAVTARDALVVAFNERELRDRMERFRDLRLDDQPFRDRFFMRGRSTNYPTGDTRGWQLSQARQKMAACHHWPQLMRHCLYRPFDRRCILWADWMIDWPRQNIMRHLVGGNNVALVARRQTPASQPCCYFWVTDTIALDGLIRSDNRGSESVFPLFLVPAQERQRDEPEGLARRAADNFLPYDGLPSPSKDATDKDVRRTTGKSSSADRPSGLPDVHSENQTGPRRANFSADFIAHCEAVLELEWCEVAGQCGEHQFGPEDLLHYIYAQFHSPSYRERFATWLRIDFPRVFVCRSATLFRQLARYGARLLAAHTLSTNRSPTRQIQGAGGPVEVPAGFPKFSEHRIWLNRRVSLGPVPEAVWFFRVGTYQVCRKWLKDRRHRRLDEQELRQYRQLLDAVELSLQLMDQIDEQIRQHGGWTVAFGPQPCRDA